MFVDAIFSWATSIAVPTTKATKNLNTGMINKSELYGSGSQTFWFRIFCAIHFQKFLAEGHCAAAHNLGGHR